MNNKKLYILFLSGFLMSFSVFSQTKKELESQRKKFKSEIPTTDTLEIINKLET